MTIALWIQTILVLFIFFGNIFLAILVLLKGSDRGTNIRFALVVITTSFWVLLSNGTNIPFGLEIQTIILKVDFIVGVIAAYTYLIFCNRLLNGSYQIPNYLIIILGLITSTFAFLACTNLIISETWLVGNVIAYKQGHWDVVYASYISVLLLASLVILSLNVKDESVARIKLQSKYILLASFIPVITIIVATLFIGRLITITNESSLFVALVLPSIGRFSIFIFTCIASYAILRYKLFGIRVLFGKMLFWALILLFVGLPVTFYLMIFRDWVSFGYLSTYIIYNVLVVMLFALNERRVRVSIKRFLINHEYDPEEVLNGFTTGLLNAKNIEDAVELFISTLKQTIKPTSIGIVVGSVEQADDVLVKWVGYSNPQIDTIQQSELLNKLFTVVGNSAPIVVGERKFHGNDTELSDQLSCLGVEMVIPLKLGIIEGLVLLGTKHNGERLSEDDLVMISDLLLRLSLVTAKFTINPK